MYQYEDLLSKVVCTKKPNWELRFITSSYYFITLSITRFCWSRKDWFFGKSLTTWPLLLYQEWLANKCLKWDSIMRILVENDKHASLCDWFMTDPEKTDFEWRTNKRRKNMLPSDTSHYASRSIVSIYMQTSIRLVSLD